MQKTSAQKLEIELRAPDKLGQKIKEAEFQFSRKDRVKNQYAQETYHHVKTIILSGNTAAVIMRKDPTQKLAAFFFYWIAGGNGGYWQYFLPSDSHMLGMLKFREKMMAVEKHNYPLNFPVDTNGERE